MGVLEDILAGRAPQQLTPEDEAQLNASLGLTPPKLDTTPTPSYNNGLLLHSIEGLAPLANIQTGVPHTFAEGLVGGFARGLGGVGEKAAAQRAEYEQKAQERERIRNAANIEATQKFRTERSQKIGELQKQQRETETADQKFNRENPVVDDAMIQRYGKNVPGLERIKGGRVSQAKLDEAITRKTPEQIYAEKAAEEKAKNANAADEPVLTDDAINARVMTFLQGLGEPTFGMGKQGVANKIKFNNRLGEIVKAGGIDIGSRITASRAEKGNLDKLTQVQGAASAFGETLEKNLKILEPTLKKLPDAGIVPLNMLLRKGATAMGSKEMAAFNTARAVVVPEITKILNNPVLTGAGVITDTARKEMETLLDPNATVGQMRAALKILRNDTKNRQDSYADAIKQSQERIRILGQIPGMEQAAPLTDEQKYQKYLEIKGGKK